MKIPSLENLRHLQKQYHRSHPWHLSSGGLFIPHSYLNMEPDSLSYWDDVGFILNGRRVIVWWQHPRHVYADAIEDQAWQEAGPSPRDNWLVEGGIKNYKRVGRSRKKLVSTTLRKPSAEQSQYYDLLREISARLSCARSMATITTTDRTSTPWCANSWALMPGALAIAALPMVWVK